MALVKSQLLHKNGPNLSSLLLAAAMTALIAITTTFLVAVNGNVSDVSKKAAMTAEQVAAQNQQIITLQKEVDDANRKLDTVIRIILEFERP